MRYFTSREFDRRLGKLPMERKDRAKKSIDMAVAFFEKGELPQGLGMKPLGHDLWEIRAGLLDRVIFHKHGNVIKFLLVGTHDEIRRFLKEY